jgi:hypothetical protein
MLMRGTQLVALSGGALGRANEGTQLYYQSVLNVEYLLQPITVLLVFIAMEGAMRAVVAGFFDEVLPSLPVVLAAALWQRARRRSGPVTPQLPDEIVHAPLEEICLRITCDANRQWKQGIALMMDGELFELASVEHGTASAPRWRYAFRRWPEGRAVRRLVCYGELRTKSLT